MTCCGHFSVACKRLKCSDWSQSPAAVSLDLNTTKRLLGVSTCPYLSGGCRVHCCHAAFVAQLAPGHRLLPHHTDWRFRPIPAVGLFGLDAWNLPIRD